MPSKAPSRPDTVATDPATAHCCSGRQAMRLHPASLQLLPSACVRIGAHQLASAVHRCSPWQDSRRRKRQDGEGFREVNN
eukprot:457456-Amphidinium_carterae.1